MITLNIYRTKPVYIVDDSVTIHIKHKRKQERIYKIDQHSHPPQGHNTNTDRLILDLLTQDRDLFTHANHPKPTKHTDTRPTETNNRRHWIQTRRKTKEVKSKFKQDKNCLQNRNMFKCPSDIQWNNLFHQPPISRRIQLRQYPTNKKHSMKPVTRQLHKPGPMHQSKQTNLHNCTRLPKIYNFRHNHAQLQMSGIKMTPNRTMISANSPKISTPSAIISHAVTNGTNPPLLHRLPANTIICDFPLQVALFLSACYKTLIFIISHCWQALMVRTKSKLTNGYTRVRTVNGSTVTTHFIPPTTSMTLRQRYRQLEHQILRNLNIIQAFNLANSTGPISTEHARAQRQRYDIIRENCDITSNKINHALHISEDPDSACSSAYHAIFLNLRTMLRNEVTRAEAINLRAITYWQQHTIPAPPTHSPSAEFHSTLPRESLLQH